MLRSLLYLLLPAALAAGCAGPRDRLQTDGVTETAAPSHSPSSASGRARSARPRAGRSSERAGRRVEELSTPKPNVPDLPLVLPAPARSPAPSAAVRALQAKAARFKRGSDYRALADAAARERAYALAADAYRREAAVYMRHGDVNGARAEEAKADYNTVTIRMFGRRQAGDADRARLDTRAPAEPPLGCYIGAFIDRDDTLGRSFPDENWQIHKDAGRFEASTGRRHASYFMYMSYGQSFPFSWANELKRHGQIPHIAWEPASLAMVRDDAYLRQFARDCARFDFPVFLRFAGEMNGNWTRYSGDPAAYRRAFRTVAAAIHRAAPRAVMLWCPGAKPVDRIAAYYPGDDAVDWVGVNLYSVVFYDNDPSRPASDDPVDFVRPIYQMYAARKPIAIGEYAATHMAAVDRRARPAFAREKIARFYGALPRLFPRLKLISWYDADNMRMARPGRQLNNYQLTDDPTIVQGYHDATADSWFLGRADEESGVVYEELRNGRSVTGTVALSAWTKAPAAGLRAYWTVDGRVRFATARPGPAAWDWDTRREDPGPHTVALVLYDGQRRFLASRALTLNVKG